MVNILTWLLHMSEELWGPTVEEFNPDREFLPQEIFFGQALASFNPNSHRFIPFSAPPRDCIGRNFSQMEARIILIELLSRFDFELAGPTLARASTSRKREPLHDFIALTSITMSPRHGVFVKATLRKHRSSSRL